MKTQTSTLFSHPFLKQGKTDEQYYEKIQSGSEYTSEYILREPEEQTTKPNKSLNAGNNKAPKDKEKLSPQKQPTLNQKYLEGKKKSRMHITYRDFFLIVL